MSPEHQLQNIESWKVVEAFIDRLPGRNAGWEPWSTLARRFVNEGHRLGLNRHFRAGKSVTHLVFSTLDHHGLRGEPRVTVEFHPENEIRIAFGSSNLWFT